MSLDLWLKFFRLLPPETSHWLMIRLLQAYGNIPSQRQNKAGSISCMGLNFPHRLGIAAGLDKDAIAYRGLMRLGFGLVEVGTVTPLPQQGNPKPRLFRLNEDQAVINRMGFNNRGIDDLVGRLQQTYRYRTCPLGINIGPNKTSKDPIQDFLVCFEAAYGIGDYFTINLSSPNTPGLRALQKGEAMRYLLDKINKLRKRLSDSTGINTPILIKLAPDWDHLEDYRHVLDAGVENDFDGFIVSNTTLSRSGTLMSAAKTQSGGLSGKPIFSLSTAMLAKAYCHLQGHLPLIGVGGISSVEEALVKIAAGANLLQLYSGLSYAPQSILSMLRQSSSPKEVIEIFTRTDEKGKIGAKASVLSSESAVTEYLKIIKLL